MRRLLLFFASSFLIFFLFLAISPKQNKAEAINQQASGLEAIPTCTTNDRTGIDNISTITFSWKDTGAIGINYGYKFWKTGDASETVVDKSTSCFNYACSIVATSLPQNQKYDWYVKTYDTGFCLFGCDVTVNGPSVTSLTCPPVTPITTYTCNNSYQCVLSATGSFSSLSSCQAACKIPTTLANNCANRSAECSNLTTYPNSLCFDFPFSSNWKCTVPPNCAMNYRVGSDTTKWTNSCAFNATQPTNNCKPLGSTTCTGGLAPDDCCPGSTCQPPGADHTALGNGTCVAAGGNLGDACYICSNGASGWSDTLGSCVDSSGNKTNYLSYLYCGNTTQTCIQGKGCVASIPTCNVVGGCDQQGTYNLQCDNTGCDTAIGHIGTKPLSIIKSLFAVALSIVGSLAVLLIILSGYRLTTSRGNPEQVKGAQEQLTAAVIGLLFVIFSLVFLEAIGIDILGLPIPPAS